MCNSQIHKNVITNHLALYMIRVLSSLVQKLTVPASSAAETPFHEQLGAVVAAAVDAAAAAVVVAVAAAANVVVVVAVEVAYVAAAVAKWARILGQVREQLAGLERQLERTWAAELDAPPEI